MTEKTEHKKKLPIILIVVAGVLVFLCVACGVFGIISGSTPEAKATATARALERTTEASRPTSTSRPTDAPRLTNTPRPTNTPRATNTPRPTNTPLPPTATPDPNLIRPGTYIVGTNIQPGIYRGQAGYDLFRSCYWARLKDVSGTLDSILANENSIGQFYVEVRSTDYALETRCELRFLSSLPEPPTEFPQKIMPGTYIVSIDIQPGTYRGQAGAEITASCYWARLRDVAGEMGSIIANDNAIGQYYIQVRSSDFALLTQCELERVGD